MQITTVEHRWKGYDPCDWEELPLGKYEDIDFDTYSVRINKNRILHLYDEELKEAYNKWYIWEKLK